MPSDRPEGLLIYDDLSYLPGPLVYLATPYTQWEDKAECVRLTAWWAAWLSRRKTSVVSPILMGQAMENHLPDWAHEDWMRWCMPMLRESSGVFVPPMHGRGESEGIRQELVMADRLVKPVVWWG